MGFYIDHTGKRILDRCGKAEAIKKDCKAVELKKPPKSLQELKQGKALIVVVDNFHFESAGFAYDDAELQAFTDPTDPRPRRFLVIDRALAVKLTNYKE